MTPLLCLQVLFLMLMDLSVPSDAFLGVSVQRKIDESNSCCWSVHPTIRRTRCCAAITNAHPTASDTTAADSTDGSEEVATEAIVLPSELNKVDPFTVLAQRAFDCLLQSDLRRDAITQKHNTTMQLLPQDDASFNNKVATSSTTSLSTTQPSSTTNWINDASAFALQKTMDRIKLKLVEERSGMDREEASSWIRWWKATPTPLIVDLSSHLRQEALMICNHMENHNYQQHHEDTSTTNTNNEMIRLLQETLGTTPDEFLNRLGCRLILLPSGASLQKSLSEPPASVIYGKLLYGGVTRYRLLKNTHKKNHKRQRRAGERLQVKTSVNDDSIPVWMQYGGPDRNYDAVDIGAAAILELILTPKGQEYNKVCDSGGDMNLSRMAWKPRQMFDFVQEQASSSTIATTHVGNSIPSVLSGKSRNEAFVSDFQSSVGGLDSQINAIVRRVLDGRIIRPVDVVDNNVNDDDETTTELASAANDAQELQLLGLTPVRGLLLYGPPGCGKTVLAREISRALQARAPKIVSAPELLDRWVGGSERLVRALFADAEAELAACGNDATKSALHVVVIDEIDAVFRKRSGGDDSGEATRASAVNQILSKLDGVNAIPNVLVIGMTNRRELLDGALLRPGRLEVQVEVPLPNRDGRREILNIHFDALRKRGRLSLPLMCAIEGVSSSNELTESNPDSSEQPFTRVKRRRLLRWLGSNNTYDLAASPTAGFSGADIAGLVRCAGSLALSRARQDGSGVEGLLITLEDVKTALYEVQK